MDGPEELFIVIVDNGRSKIYQDLKVREILKCIRCGACLNICPIYAKIGGYPYGFTYSGPMGQILNPMLLGIENTSDLYHACTLCGACKKICPAGINHPSVILEYRARQIENRNHPTLFARLEYATATFLSLAMGSSTLWNTGVKCARPLLNLLAKDGYIRDMPFGAKGWFSCRDLRAMPAKTFREMWRELSHSNPHDVRKKETI
jgi:L-lactate dehydrogenase complex protein LldF